MINYKLVTCRYDLTFKCVTVRPTAGGWSKVKFQPGTFLTDAESPTARIVADRERPRIAPITFPLAMRILRPFKDFPLCPRRLKTLQNSPPATWRLNNGIERRSLPDLPSSHSYTPSLYHSPFLLPRLHFTS